MRTAEVIQIPPSAMPRAFNDSVAPPANPTSWTLSDLFSPAGIQLEVKAATKRVAFGHLAALLAVSSGANRDNVLAALLRRERLGPTYIGDGFAMPHARVPDSLVPAAAILRLRHPVDYGTAEDDEVHLLVGITWPDAAAIVRSRRKLCESVLSTLDFFPPARGNEQRTERDPFMFFARYAGDAAAVPALDHYIDVLDGRRINWRRPRQDPYRLASELHRLSTAVKNDDTPALQEQYLELLAGLRDPVTQDSEWIGTIRDGAFRPAPERFAEPSPTMRYGLGIGADPIRSADVYGTCVSVNVSLAARCFKRRMLELEVTDPFTPRSRTKTKGEEIQVSR